MNGLGTPLLRFIDWIKIWQLFLAALLLTFLFAGFYFGLSKTNTNNGLVTPTENTTSNEVGVFDAIYFSVVTEATLGYGDIRPVGWARALACLQVLLGLLIAGLFVAKITSFPDRRLRVLSSKAEGYWLETFQVKDQPKMCSFVHIYYDGEMLRYEGDNFDINGSYQGSFEGSLISSDSQRLSFYYKNIDKTHLFDSGIAEITFSAEAQQSRWSFYKAINHDHVKTEKTYFEGKRASVKQIEVFNSGDQANRRTLILGILT